MYLKLKRSKIGDWWIGKKNNKLAFCKIKCGKVKEDNLYIVGHLKSNEQSKKLFSSQNRVVRVTKRGVITAKGSFYPFKEAHQLYLRFLIESNKPNVVLAYKWEFIDEKSNFIIADIVLNGEMKEKVTFDFYQKDKNEMFDGYSTLLFSDVILSTFDKRDVCMKLDIPRKIISDIYYTSQYFEQERIETLKGVKKVLK